MKDPVIASPHQGARYYLVEELDDREHLGELVRRTCAQLPPQRQIKISDFVQKRPGHFWKMTWSLLYFLGKCLD